MENQFVQKLPNANTVLILGIVSLVMCCCMGVGLIPSIIGLVLANKDSKLYQSNPTGYSGYQNLNTGKVLCIIALVIGVINVLSNLYIWIFVGMDNFQEAMQEFQLQMQQQQQQ